jgi:hypothetical protein
MSEPIRLEHCTQEGCFVGVGAKGKRMDSVRGRKMDKRKEKMLSY